MRARAPARAASTTKRATRFFLDTNILVYCFSESEPGKREVARQLAEADGAVVSTQVLNELANVLTRRFRVPPVEAAARIRSVASHCEVTIVHPAIILDAFRIMDRYGFRFFDSQIVATALAEGIDTLLTEDLQHGQLIDGVLKLHSPFAIRATESASRYRVAAGNARAAK